MTGFFSIFFLFLVGLVCGVGGFGVVCCVCLLLFGVVGVCVFVCLCLLLGLGGEV